MNNPIMLSVLTTLLLSCLIYTAQGKASFWKRGTNVQKSHNLTLGKPSKSDKLLFHKVVSRPAIKNRQNLAYVVYPVAGHKSSAIISCIRAIDHWTNGTGGYPTLVNGGVGQRHATIRITSVINLGFKFTIQIYGK